MGCYASGIEIVVVGIAIFFGFILACLILILFSAKVSGMTMVEFAKSTATRAAAEATVVAIDITAHLNQMYVAAKFARDNLILHEPAQSTFYGYESESGLWIPVSNESVKLRLGIWLRQALHDSAKHLLKSLTQNMLSQILPFFNKPKAFNRKSNIVHVGNGVLNLDNATP